jgi:Spy/CpxP family protein refolding chaperone
MIKRQAFALMLGVAAAATPVMGQDLHQHGQAQVAGAEGGMSGAGMMMYMPSRLLDASDALGLNEDQRAALGTIQDQAQPEHQEHMRAAMSAGEGACSALTDEAPDWALYGDKLREGADHGVSAHVVMMRAASEAKGVLTAEQVTMIEADGHGAMSGTENPRAMGSMGSMDHAVRGGMMGGMGSMGSGDAKGDMHRMGSDGSMA